MEHEIDRIECAIRHIESSVDIDPWACEIAVHAMQELIKRTRGWIPVSEAVPEPDERVAVTTGGYEYHVWDCMSNRGDDYFWEDEEGYYHNKYAVDAWMPLPEPYKEEE